MTASFSAHCSPPHLLGRLILISLALVPAHLAAAPSRDIKVDQVGYLRTESKFAVVTSSAARGRFEVRRVSDDVSVFSGILRPAMEDPSHSGDTVRWADFSELDTPGLYYLEVAGVGTSYDFEIGDDTFSSAFYLAMRGFYGQRCGTAVDLAPTFPSYTHRPCHTGDAEFHLCAAGRSGSRSGTRGWHDAGDYGKYSVNSGIATGTLLWTYERYFERIGTVHLDIPESGDGTPDILDEIKWNLDWMLKMQGADGGVFHKLTRASFSPFLMPEDDTATRYFVGTGEFPYKSSCATADFAAVMAIAARVYRPFDRTFANTCLAAAEEAWIWVSANPDVTYANSCGISTGSYGDSNCADERLWAAAELFRATGRATYDSYFLSHYDDYSPKVSPTWPQSWYEVRNLAMWAYLSASGANAQARHAIRSDTISAADAIVNRSATNAYRHSIRAEEYVWGSNALAVNYALLLLIAYDLETDTRYLDSALDNLHYLLGRNTHNVSWVTQLGDNPFENPHHRPSGADANVAPWPGLLAGGPNAYDYDGSSLDAIPLTPPMRRWVDEQASYASNEIAINWNAPLVYVLASTLPVVHTLEVTKAGAGCGTVTSEPSGIDCGPTCSHVFAHGTSVTLTAIPCWGATFAGWSGDCTGTEPCSTTMEAPRSVTAQFDLETPGVCPETESNLCLNRGRFKVEVRWRDFEGNAGSGRVVPVSSDDSGLFWFFEPDNWEMLVKVLDGCVITNRFWVFSAATTNVEYVLRVTDTKTGEVREYPNPLGRAAPAITDTEAFATCP